METQLEFVKRRLKEATGRWPDVAKGSGVNLNTIIKIGAGKTSDPRISNVEALTGYFRRLDKFNEANEAALAKKPGP